MATSVISLKDGNLASFTQAVELNNGIVTPHICVENSGTPVSSSNPLPVSDFYNAPYIGVNQIALGSTVVPGRSVGYVITTSGNLTFVFQNGSSLTLTLPVGGFSTWPFAVTKLIGDGTIVGTYWNMS